jgi:hypothetical protein
MSESNPVATESATMPLPILSQSPLSHLPIDLSQRLSPAHSVIARLIAQFRASGPTPRSAFEFESQLSELLRDVGKQVVEWTYNDCEPSRDLLPKQLKFDGAWYQLCCCKTANRHVATLFGTITLMRFPYRPTEESLPCIFPLEICLGLEQARATPAMADRIGQYMAQCTQHAVQRILNRDHGVQVSVALLRKITAGVSEGMSAHCHAAQVEKLLDLLMLADASRGNRRIVISVGRDGIFLPIRKAHGGMPEYREGAVATLSVFDRAGNRLGTVHLGRMPEEGQPTLSSQLTALIQDVLKQWTGPMPRLVYVTDAGYQQTQYYKKVLRRMSNPRSPGQRLKWEWVLDFYHACQYITDLGVALFGEGREAQAWAAKMRHRLKHKPNGIYRVLHSAAALRQRRGLVGKAKDYDTAYDYLRRRTRHLDYNSYRKLHLPIGSGVTEACCKTMFTQRFKQSGMAWDIESGQTIVNLRVVHLSGIWESVREAYLRSKTDETMRTQMRIGEKPVKKAA